MKGAIFTAIATVFVVLSLAPTALIAADGDFARAVRFRASDTSDRDLAEAVRVVVDQGFLPQIVEAWKATEAQAQADAPAAPASGVDGMIQALQAADAFMATYTRSAWHTVQSVTLQGTGGISYWEVVVLTSVKGRRGMPRPMSLYVTSDLQVSTMVPRRPGRR